MGPRITLMAIVMAMTFPLAGHAQVSTRNDVQDAERSPLFQRKFATDRISASGLDRVHLDNGVVLELGKYVNLTRLDRSGNFKSLMTAAVVDEYLRSTPGYVENVLQLQDRLIIERTMKVALKEGVCRRGNLPASVKELCFAPGSGPLPDETRKYLVGLRARLDAASPGAVVRNGMTARQLAGMNDEQLLEALLNSDDRVISLVSVLPTEVYRTQARADLRDTSRRLRASDFSVAANAPVTTGSGSSRMPVVGNATGNGSRVFPTKYFLTGFTLGREISDVFEIQIARATPFTDRYFVRFEYEFSVGLGLRFPFSVSVEAQAGNARVRPAVPQGGSPRNAPPPRGRAGESGPSHAGAGNRPVRSATSGGRTVRDHRTTAAGPARVVAGDRTPATVGTPVMRADIGITVSPVNVQANGEPAYPAVDLPRSKYFDGKEFVLKFHAGCRFKASIPGDDINLGCPTVDFDRSRDIDPVIGSDRAQLATLWLDGSVTGLGIQAWAGTASLDFGISANLANGRISLNANGLNNTLVDDRGTHSLVFRDKGPQRFKVANGQGSSAAFSLDTPGYGFDLELRPVARARFDLDLGIRKLSRTLGPYSLDALALTVAGFGMGHHDGTVGSHVYSF